MNLEISKSEQSDGTWTRKLDRLGSGLTGEVFLEEGRDGRVRAVKGISGDKIASGKEIPHEPEPTNTATLSNGLYPALSRMALLCVQQTGRFPAAQPTLSRLFCLVSKSKTCSYCHGIISQQTTSAKAS